MKKQVSLKASIRQPIRTLIFTLLVAVATFGFVARVVEFTILNNEINRLSQFYRTVGSLVPLDATTTNNVYHAANLIADSPFIEFDDRRVMVQGVMDDVLNATLEFYTEGGHSLQVGQNPFAYKDVYPFESFAVVEIVRSFRRSAFITGTHEIFETHTLSMQVVDVIYGHDQFVGGRQLRADFIVDENGNSAVDHLQQGGHYLVRATMQNARGAEPRLTLDIFPIVDDILFVSMDDEDMLAYVWETLADEIEILNANVHMLMLAGTRDMTALPFIQTGLYERFQGRLLTQDDYINANPVIVIPQSLDSRRAAARVGETITITLRNMQTFPNGAPAPEWVSPGVFGHWQNLPAGYWTAIPKHYAGDWQNYEYITLELEVVGTYLIPAHWPMPPRWQHIASSFRNWEAFIPASLIPEGWGIAEAHLVSGAYSFVLNSAEDILPFRGTLGTQLNDLGFDVAFYGADARNFYASVTPIRNAITLNLVLFSAVLIVVLALTVFLYLKQRYREFAIMRALGITQGSAIAQVIAPVLLFWLPVVIAASIGGWYFALGQASEGLQALLEIDVPADMGEVLVRMNILERARWEAERVEIYVTPNIDMIYLAWFCTGLVAAWVIAILSGVLSFAGQSMLSLIQRSQGAGAVVRTAKETAPPATFDIQDVGSLLAKRTTVTVMGRLQASRCHHARHIWRSPVKSVLVVGLALLFIVAMGWLNTTIRFTEGEMERLYNTTPVTGIMVDPSLDINSWSGHDIPLQSLNAIRESEFVESYFYTRQRHNEWLLLPMYMGELEDRFEDITDLQQGGFSPAWDLIVEISSWEGFVADASRPVAFGTDIHGEFEYFFAPGFDISDFVRNDGQAPVPIIVPEWYLQGRWLHFHETGIFAWAADMEDEDFAEVVVSPDECVRLAALRNYARYTEAVIIGWYSGGHPNSAAGAIIMPSFTAEEDEGNVSSPQEYFEGTITTVTGVGGGQFNPTPPDRLVSTLSFNVNPAMSRYLVNFTEEMAERLVFTEIFSDIWVPLWGGGLAENLLVNYNHQLIINDAELRLVIMPLESNLNLLRLLYPMVLALSFVLSLGLCLMIMLQNAKNAAIMRVLGMPKAKTRLNLFMELVAVCFIGLLIGFAAVLIMGVTLPEALLLAAVYLGGAIIGTAVGVIVVSQRTPLDLLQVRE